MWLIMCNINIINIIINEIVILFNNINIMCINNDNNDNNIINVIY